MELHIRVLGTLTGGDTILVISFKHHWILRFISEHSYERNMQSQHAYKMFFCTAVAYLWHWRWIGVWYLTLTIFKRTQFGGGKVRNTSWHGKYVFNIRFPWKRELHFIILFGVQILDLWDQWKLIMIIYYSVAFSSWGEKEGLNCENFKSL